MKAAKTTGFIIGVILASVLLFAGVPFLFFLTVRDLFGVHVENTFLHYISFWVLAITFRLATQSQGRFKVEE